MSRQQQSARGGLRALREGSYRATRAHKAVALAGSYSDNGGIGGITLASLHEKIIGCSCCVGRGACDRLAEAEARIDVAAERGRARSDGR
jgi:hypothetical protein